MRAIPEDYRLIPEEEMHPYDIELQRQADCRQANSVTRRRKIRNAAHYLQRIADIADEDWQYWLEYVAMETKYSEDMLAHEIEEIKNGR